MKGGSRYISLGVAKKTNRQVKGQRLTASSNGAVFPPAEQQQPCRAFRSVFFLSKHQIETRFNCKFELGRFREAAPLPSYFSSPPPTPYPARLLLVAWACCCSPRVVNCLCAGRNCWRSSFKRRLRVARRCGTTFRSGNTVVQQV